MSNRNSFSKDPDAVLDYEIDWSSWLVGDDTIVSSTWTVPVDGGLIKDSDSHTATTATIWLSDGELGSVSIPVVNRIVTAQGRTEDRTITFTISQR